MASKKAIALTLETIVVAALAIVAMIVLILIFTGRIKLFSQEVNDCAKAYGECIPENECPVLSRAPHPCGKGKVCCVNFCLSEGGKCQKECSDDPSTPDIECPNKCPKGTTRIYTAGCGIGEVCCKG